MRKKTVFVFLGILLFVLAWFAFRKHEESVPAPAPEAMVSTTIKETLDKMGFPAALVGEQFEYAVQQGDYIVKVKIIRKGKKAKNARAQFNVLFEEVEESSNDTEDEIEFDQTKLDQLEAQ